jgi:ATP-dependent Clp protease ATP-binding subunit ClpX
LDDIEVDFTEEAIDQLASNTLKLKTGARGLHSELERVLMPHMYRTRSYQEKNIKKISITLDQVLNPISVL